MRRIRDVRVAVGLVVLIGAACGHLPPPRVESGHSGHEPDSGREVEQAQARGLAALSSGHYGAAVPDLRLVLRARPADLETRYNLGVALLRLHSWTEAERVFEAEDAPSVVKRDLAAGLRVPTAADADYLHALGSCYREQDALPAALACFDAALARDGGHLKSRYARALVLESQGDLQAARKAWLDYIERDPAGTWNQSARRHLESVEGQLRTSLRKRSR